MLAWFVAAALGHVVVASASACSDPAIVTASQTSMQHQGALDVYDVAIVVRNLGTVRQAPSLLQSVEVYQDATKVGQIGLRPLAPGASQTVSYELQRSAGGRTGSTRLRFVLVMHDPHGVPFTDCNAANDVFRLAI